MAEFALASLPEILIFTEGYQVILVDVKKTEAQMLCCFTWSTNFQVFHNGSS